MGRNAPAVSPHTYSCLLPPAPGPKPRPFRPSANLEVTGQMKMDTQSAHGPCMRAMRATLPVSASVHCPFCVVCTPYSAKSFLLQREDQANHFQSSITNRNLNIHN